VPVIQSTGTPLSGVIQVAAGIGYTCALAAGSVLCWGSNSTGAFGEGATADSSFLVGGNSQSGVTRIDAGSYHVCAVVAQGSDQLYCWGLNNSGEFGNGTTATSLVPVAVVGLV